MPSRVIRGDDLLESDRYKSLSAAAQVFYIHLMCCADDFGLVLLSPLSIGRRCFKVRPGAAKLESLIRLLESADLIRPYAFEGAPFAFIPRFRQRLKNFPTKHPMPPPELFADDEEAKLNFTKYKDIFKKRAPGGGGTSPTSGKSPPDLEVDLEVDLEEKRRDLEGKGKREGEGQLPSVADTALPPVADQDHNPILENGLQVKGNGNGKNQSNGVRQGKDLQTWAAAKGLHRGQQESESDFNKRLTHDWLLAKKADAERTEF